MEIEIEGLDFKSETESTNQENKTNNGSNWLSVVLLFFSWIELLAGIGFGIDFVDKHDINAFFFALVGGIIGFVIFQALSVCVKAANKYLNN